MSAEIKVNIIGGGLGRTSTNTDKVAALLYLGTDTDNSITKLTRANQKDYPLAVGGVQYQIDEFFRFCPDGTLYLYARTLGGGGSPNPIETPYLDELMSVAKDARVVGYADNFYYSSLPGTGMKSNAGLLQAWATERMEKYAQPLRVVYSARNNGFIESESEYFSEGTNNRVMALFSGQALEGTYTMGVGTMLGVLCGGSVHQKPSWRVKRIDNGTNWSQNYIQQVTGAEFTPTPELVEEQKAYDSYGLCIAGSTPGRAGTTYLNSRMACGTSDDFAIINNGRTIDKAIKLVYDALAPLLDSPLYVNTTSGELAADTVETFRATAYNAIVAGMIEGKAGNEIELSIDPNTGTLSQDAVYIDPAQNVLSTETLNVQISLTPVGAAKVIVINIGLANPAN